MSEKKESKKTIEEKLKECEEQKEEYLNGWKRAKADFINYKREEAGRTKEMMNYSKAELLSSIIEILDNFEKAEEETPEDVKNDNYFQGLLRIKDQFNDFLKSQGVKKVKAIGEKIDLNYHEIVEEVENKEEKSGIVVEEVQKGYLFEGRLLRPAKVKVSK
jgi:molecular chaperone GrpE